MTTAPSAQTPTPSDPADVLARWEAQQAAYITHREARFEVMLDVVAAAVPGDGTVLDLACGPGSISARVVRRFPGVRCLGLDLDPALLRLARESAAVQGRCEQTTFCQVDLHDPDWVDALGGARPDAVLTSTALHWLPAPVLVRLYAQLADLLPVGGVFVNADHLRAGTGRPLFEELAARDDTATHQAAVAAGADTWAEWFALLQQDPQYADALHERADLFAQRPPNPDLSPEFHLQALRCAGFAEAGVVWQHYDDYVLLARR